MNEASDAKVAIIDNVVTSLTRFGEISPLWKTFEPTLKTFYAIGQIFNVVSDQIMKK